MNFSYRQGKVFYITDSYMSYTEYIFVRALQIEVCHFAIYEQNTTRLIEQKRVIAYRFYLFFILSRSTNKVQKFPYISCTDCSVSVTNVIISERMELKRYIREA